MKEQLVLDMAPGQIWAGSDYVLLPLRWDSTGGPDVSLVIEVFRGSENFETWIPLEELQLEFLTEFPGARRLA